MANIDKEFCAQPTQPTIVKPKPDSRSFKMNDRTNLFVKHKNKIRKCVQCQVPTTYKCTLTDDFVCSVECQELVVRGPCPPVPKATEEDMPSTTSPLVGPVRLVGYSSARSLSVRPVKDHEDYIRLMNEIGTKAASMNYLKNFSSGYVLALYKGLWYRGTIVKLMKPKKLARVLLPDLDIEQVFQLRQLKCPDKSFKLLDMPVTVQRCTLAGVVRAGISYECEKIYERLVEEQTPLVVAQEEQGEIVFQVDHVGGQNLTELVNRAMEMTVSNEGPSHYLKDLPVVPVMDQENVPMLVTDLSDCQYAVSVAHCDHFKRCYAYEEHFQEFANKTKGIYTPCDKELCLIRMAEGSDPKVTRWLRAFGLMNEGDQFPRFELVDYGFIVKVNIASVRKIPKELLYPAATWAYSPVEVVVDQGVKGAVTMFPVVVEKIHGATQEKPTGQISCSNLMQQLKDVPETLLVKG